MPKLVVSQNERILVHLYELEKYREDPDVPMGSSQEGIAQRLGTQVFNASRALSSLESEGLVFDRLAHVRGAPKRRRAYFLTEKGKTAANAIRTDIGKRKITIEHAGKAQELPVDEAVRKLTSILGRTVGLSEVVELSREFDPVLSSSLTLPAEAQAPSKEFVILAHGRPKVDAFYGREMELQMFSEAVSEKQKHALLLWGMPGIGKSTLASRMFESLVGKASLLWYSFHEWDSERSLLGVIAEFFQSCGASSTVAALRRGSSGGDLYGSLAADMHDSEFAIFLDDVQKPIRDVSSILSVIVEAAKSSKGIIIMISRSAPTYFSRTEASNLSIELGEMDRDSAWRLAQNLSSGDAIKLVEQSHGNPLLLTLMARGNISQSMGDIISFIEREVSSSLAPDERNALELLSIFRHPVPLDALEGVQYKTVVELRRRALVIEGEDGISTHDILRDFFISHLTREAKELLHRKVAEYCERMIGVEWILESLYHRVEGRDWRGSARVATVHSAELGKDFPQETLSLLQRIDIKSLELRDRAEILFLLGQLNEFEGKLDAALSNFQESLSLLGSEPDSAKRALVLETSAKLQARAKRWTESMASHRDALQLYEKSGDTAGQAREWMNIGSALRKKGDFAQAREAYEKALALSSKSEDRSAQAACLNNIGLLEWDEGKMKEAELRLKESVRLAHAVEDHSGEGRGLENLGELMRNQGKLDEAARISLESSAAFRRAGEAVDYKRLIAITAELLGLIGREKEALELCERTLVRPELRRRRGLFQRVSRFDTGDLLISSTLFELYRATGDYGKAERELSRYFAMGDTISDPSLLAKGRMMMAVVKEDTGDLDSSLRALDEAGEILRTIGDSSGLIAVHMRRGIVHEKKGDYAAAEQDYKEAARHADLVGDSSSLALANENLNSLAR